MAGKTLGRRLLAGLAVASIAVLPAVGASGATGVGGGGGTPGTHANFRLVGHNTLFGRGMNSAATIYRDFIYIGSRTDASDGHKHQGVLILSIKDPAHPTVVGAIRNEQAQVGITSREVRVWPQQKLLFVSDFPCSTALHDCGVTHLKQTFWFSIYDLTDPVHPRLITRWVPRSRAGVPVEQHENFLWLDPRRPATRALMFISTPTLSNKPSDPNLLVEDISQARQGKVKLVSQFNANQFYPHSGDPASYNFNLFTHSMAVTADGSRTYLAEEAGEFLVLDSTAVTSAAPGGQFKLLTPPRNRPTWGNPNGHSSVPVPGRHFALTTDEIYGTFTDPSFGCPWGWARLIDVADPAHPRIVGEYKIAQDERSFCRTTQGHNDARISYSSHNPTVLPTLAFIDWHSGGVQAINIADPAHPSQAGWFSPVPLKHVTTEDPALGQNPNKVIMWSYPIIDKGLIYVMDIRNGLYILKYTGRQHQLVDGISFYEGNSTVGDALRLSR